MFKLEIWEFDSKDGTWKQFRDFIVDSMGEAVEVFNLFAVAFNRVGITTSADVYKICEDNSSFEFECQL